MAFEKMTPIEGGHGGCRHCGYQHEVLQMEAIIAVGFGYAALTKNDDEIYSENMSDEYMTVEQAEKLAAADPDHDWRIHFVGPLSERHYQRQDDRHWVLYEKGEGFA